MTAHRLVGECTTMSAGLRYVTTWGPEGLVERDHLNNGAVDGRAIYQFDAEGNVLHRVDSNGQVQDSYQFDGFGKLLKRCNVTGTEIATYLADPYGYKGKYGYYTDSNVVNTGTTQAPNLVEYSTGLIYCWHRYYDPDAGGGSTVIRFGTRRIELV